VTAVASAAAYAEQLRCLSTCLLLTLSLQPMALKRASGTHLQP
jgi:hypothetical protein